MTYVIWDKTSAVKTPSGISYEAAEFVQLRVPYAAQGDEVVMGVVGDVMYTFDSLAGLVDRFGIDPELPNYEKLQLVVEGIHREADPNYDEIEDMIEAMERAVQGDDD